MPFFVRGLLGHLTSASEWRRLAGEKKGKVVVLKRQPE